MLNLARPLRQDASGPRMRRQQGVVLMIALIMLVAMTLAGIALVRSVDTSNIIAGNLAFQQSATSAGDTGTEAAITWLVANSGGSTLENDVTTGGYFASRSDPAAGQSWDAFWTNVLAGQAKAVGKDLVTKNTVSYVIQRLCQGAGASTAPSTGCAAPPVSSSSSGNSMGGGVIALQRSSQVYYRITTRVDGPRNSVSYIQSIIAL